MKFWRSWFGSKRTAIRSLLAIDNATSEEKIKHQAQRLVSEYLDELRREPVVDVTLYVVALVSPAGLHRPLTAEVEVGHGGGAQRTVDTFYGYAVQSLKPGERLERARVRITLQGDRLVVIKPDAPATAP